MWIMSQMLLLCLLTSLMATFYVHTNAETSSMQETPPKKVVCYYTAWSHKRGKDPAYHFLPDNVDPFVCTHIIYAFADIGLQNNIVPADPEFDFKQKAYVNITSLKKKNKNLKVMIGIGGWTHGTVGFGLISSNQTNREEFAKNAARYLRGYNFDGLDLNWQHPTLREGGTPEDRPNYVLLAQTLREEFEREAVAKNKPRLLLSIAISHNEKFLPGYDIPSFNNYMDFISVICYDYHFSYETEVNHHSPLYPVTEDTDYSYDPKINSNYTIHLFLEQADADKLVLGIPTYGRTYTLVDPAETALGSEADGAGAPGPILSNKGFMAYFEICNQIKNENWTVVQTKPGHAGPYAFKGDQWVCFDDLQMIRNKAEYAKKTGLAGVMFWTMDFDDFLGECHDTKYPLIRAARDQLTAKKMFDDGDSETLVAVTEAISSEPVELKTTTEPPVTEAVSSEPIELKTTTTTGPTTITSGTKSTSTRSPTTDGRLSNVHSTLPKRTNQNKAKILIERPTLNDEYSAVQQTPYKSVLETPGTLPILLSLSNSSINIKRVNIYHTIHSK